MPMINEQRLFSLIEYFFKEPSGVLKELAQNATRAGASRFGVTYDNGILTVEDNGAGIADPRSLLVLAESDWSDEVEKDQNPAGWGLFFLYCMSDSIELTSRFGTLKMDCDRFLKDAAYREGVLAAVDAGAASEGFSIRAEIKSGVRDGILKESVTASLGWFPLDVTVNGEKIARNSIDAEKYDIVTAYEGNDVYIKAKDIGGQDQFALGLFVNWYGFGINPRGWRSWDVAIDVKKGAPLTPVLPYRSEVKNDDKLKKFHAFVEKKLAEYVLNRLNSLDDKAYAEFAGNALIAVTRKNDILGLQNVLINHGVQEDVDRLERFVVRINEPFYSNSIRDDYNVTYAVASRKNPEILIETLSVEGTAFFLPDGADVMTEEDEDLEYCVFLPSGVIKRALIPSKLPGWVRVKEVNKTLTIVTEGPCHDGTMKWQKATLRMDDGSTLNSLVYSESSYSGNEWVFYAQDPSGAWNELENVFSAHYYSEDGNDYDTQRDSFVADIERDITDITGCYSLSKLLNGFHDVRVNPYTIRRIEIEGGEGNKTVKVTTDKEVFAFNAA